MKVREKHTGSLFQIVAIAVHVRTDWNFPDRVIMYGVEKGLYGVSALGLQKVEIVDNEIDIKLRVHITGPGDDLFLLWDYFQDVSQLSKLVDLDETEMRRFEEARYHLLSE